MKAAVILPSRNESATISAVAVAADDALGGGSVIIHADSSDTAATVRAFTATRTRAAKITLAGLTRGKGAQVLAAARRAEAAAADVVLVADTDTRNPDPAVYRALLQAVRGGAGLAIADYPRHWDEANLTSHLARPLIAAATGLDVPQPLAGDLAVSGQALGSAVRACEALPGDLGECAEGYGIDAFLLLTAAARGPVTSVPFQQAKLHAGSFPHLPAIYQQAVPVLLYLTAQWTPGGAAGAREPAVYRTGDRLLAPRRLEEMLAALDAFVPPAGRYDGGPWPAPVADAWRAVRSGTPAADASRRLWPHYVTRVRDWLAAGQGAAPGRRAAALSAAHACLHAALISDGAM